MFSVFSQAKDLFDKRFQLNAFLPSLLFWATIAALVLTGGHPTTRGVTKLYQDFGAAEQWLVGGAFVIGCLIFANWLDSAMLQIVKYFEGYWPSWLEPLTNWGKGYYVRKLNQLREAKDQDVAYPVIARAYPPAQRPWLVLPTRLGNILRNAETYPSLRYKMDAVLLWPRLYHLLPDGFRQAMTSTRSSLELMLVISMFCGALSLFSGVYLYSTHAPAGLYAVFTFGTLGISVFSYQAACRLAGQYGALIKSAFDLYRNLLLKQMRIVEPHDTDEERILWDRIGQRLYRGAAPLNYDKPQTTSFTSLPDTGQPPAERLFSPLPFFALPTLALFFAGTIALALPEPERREVLYVVKSEVAPYSPLNPQNFGVTYGPVVDGAVASSQAVYRFAKVRVPASSPLKVQDVGPLVPKGKSRVIAVRAGLEATLGGTIKAGDKVRLGISGSTAFEWGLVVDVKAAAEPKPYLMIVAVRDEKQLELARASEEGKLIIVRA
jgi:hypothetical protein